MRHSIATIVVLLSLFGCNPHNEIVNNEINESNKNEQQEVIFENGLLPLPSSKDIRVEQLPLPKDKPVYKNLYNTL